MATTSDRESAIDLGTAFPTALRPSVAAVRSIMPYSRLRPVRPVAVRVGGETLSIPYRIYDNEPEFDLVQGLSPEQRLVLHCIYTRHHDGHVRQRHAEAVAGHTHQWVLPFVVGLLGEYVVEMVLAIRDELIELEVPGTPMHAAYGQFGAANKPFLTLTQQRAASYWNCYYRSRYAERRLYPNFEILAAIRAAAAAYSSRRGREAATT